MNKKLHQIEEKLLSEHLSSIDDAISGSMESGLADMMLVDDIERACPFCGKYEHYFLQFTDDNTFAVACRYCNAHGPVAGDKKEAVEAYNG